MPLLFPTQVRPLARAPVPTRRRSPSLEGGRVQQDERLLAGGGEEVQARLHLIPGRAGRRTRDPVEARQGGDLQLSEGVDVVAVQVVQSVETSEARRGEVVPSHPQQACPHVQPNGPRMRPNCQQPRPK